MLRLKILRLRILLIVLLASATLLWQFQHLSGLLAHYLFGAFPIVTIGRLPTQAYAIIDTPQVYSASQTTAVQTTVTFSINALTKGNALILFNQSTSAALFSGASSLSATYAGNAITTDGSVSGGTAASTTGEVWLAGTYTVTATGVASVVVTAGANFTSGQTVNCYVCIANYCLMACSHYDLNSVSRTIQQNSKYLFTLNLMDIISVTATWKDLAVLTGQNTGCETLGNWQYGVCDVNLAIQGTSANFGSALPTSAGISGIYIPAGTMGLQITTFPAETLIGHFTVIYLVVSAAKA